MKTTAIEPSFGSNPGQRLRRNGHFLLLGLSMLLALGVALGINLLLEAREARAALADFQESQTRLTEVAAGVLQSALATPATDRRPFPTTLQNLCPLEHRELARIFIHPPQGPWLTLQGEEVKSSALAMALREPGTWLPVDRSGATSLGLPGRTAALSLATARDPLGNPWRVAVAGTAYRERDRAQFARWRLTASFVSMATFLSLVAGWALRFQTKELRLARALELKEWGRLRDQELSQANRAATVLTLASGVAHEVSTPLGVISGRAAQMASRTRDDDRLARIAQAVQDEVTRIDQTLRKFLDLARGGSPAAEEIATASLVRSAAAMVAHRFNSAEVELRLQVPDHLPGLRGDPRLLEQMLVNLLLNACDASRPGQWVQVTAIAAEGRVVLVVADQGDGIPEALTEKVLEPFFTTKPQGKGTGLGLAIVKEILRMHRGEIRFERGHPRGTEVRLELPGT